MRSLDGAAPVTDWRTWPAWRQVMAAAFDRVSGAATVGASAARALRELVLTVVDLAPAAYPTAVADALERLLTNQPAMAPVTNLANEVYLALPEGPERVAQILQDVAQRLEESAERIGRTGAPLILDRSTVLTHSASSSVRAVFLEARRQRRFRICCTESLPEGEGVAMAADLAVVGFEVEVVPDDAALEVLPGMDLFMVGVDAFGPRAALNKVGSAVLAREAARLGIPVYLVASREKALPPSLFERAAASAGRDEFFELIPFDHVTAVVTEEEALTPERAALLAAERPVAAELG